MDNNKSKDNEIRDKCSRIAAALTEYYQKLGMRGFNGESLRCEVKRTGGSREEIHGWNIIISNIRDKGHQFKGMGKAGISIEQDLKDLLSEAGITTATITPTRYSTKADFKEKSALSEELLSNLHEVVSQRVNLYASKIRPLKAPSKYIAPPLLQNELFMGHWKALGDGYGNPLKPLVLLKEFIGSIHTLPSQDKAALVANLDKIIKVMATPKKIREGVGGYETTPPLILVGNERKTMMELAAAFDKSSQSLKPAEQLGRISELSAELETINEFTQKQIQREITSLQFKQPSRQ